ncbi:MAG TPA: helix-turn-helix transcriptional regulator [Streptosporangiaceae bacterium]
MRAGRGPHAARASFRTDAPGRGGLDGASAESLLQMRRALGRQLAALRNRAGLSQWDLAPLTGYSRSTLSDAELGRHRLRREFWLRCDQLLNADSRLLAAYDRIETAAAVLEQRAHGPAQQGRERGAAARLRAVQPGDRDCEPAPVPPGPSSRVAMETCPHCRRPIAVLIVPSPSPSPSPPAPAPAPPAAPTA